MDIYKIYNSLLDLIFPPRCQVCRQFSETIFCPKCLNKIQYVEPQLICTYCGIPMIKSGAGMHNAGQLCQSCIRQKPHFELARSMVIYAGVIRRAIHQFKFNGKKLLAEPLNDIFKTRMHSAFPEIVHCGAEVTIAVPLAKRRQNRRGFNQSEVLAKSVAGCLGIPYRDLIITRTRETLPQFGLPKEKRKTNVSGAFCAHNSKEILGRRVLLVDDIYTTGATVNECAKVLKQDGAAKIYVLTLARAVRD